MKNIVLTGVLIIFTISIFAREYPGEFSAEEQTSSGTTLVLDWENDIFLNSDYYFTNGAALTVINSKLAISFIDRILRSPLSYTNKRYSLEIRQNMYTPEKMYEPGIQYGDRPFAGYLTVTYNSETYSNRKRMVTALTVGTVGRFSGAGFTQNFIHSFNNMQQSEGWVYQIKDTPVINIKYQFENNFINTTFLYVGYKVRAQVGTLNTDAYAQTSLKLGVLASGYDMPEKSDGFQAYIYTGFGTKISVYNATLQGGVIGRQPNHYYIREIDRNAVVLDVTFGFVATYKNMYLKTGFTFISPEFVDAKPHGWGAITVAYTF